MPYQIVSNNPQVVNDYNDVLFVEGSFDDVLLKTRDLAHQGHAIINHPLGASIRMFFSPYRSIIVSAEPLPVLNLKHIEIIENSIENYHKQMKHRTPDIKNGPDYMLIDSELLKSALAEHGRMNN